MLSLPGIWRRTASCVSQPRDPSGQRPCSFWCSSTQLPLSRATAGNPCMCSEAPMEGLLGPGILGLFNPHPPKEAAGKSQKTYTGFAPTLPGAKLPPQHFPRRGARHTCSQPTIDGTCGRQGRRSVTQLYSTLGRVGRAEVAPTGAQCALRRCQCPRLQARFCCRRRSQYRLLSLPVSQGTFGSFSN